MTDKAYIVANEQQEREVLDKLELEGITWRFKSKPTEWVPTRDSYSNVQFPYVLFNDDGVTWGEISELEDNHEICYDGRKEEKMKISKEVYDALFEWKNNLVLSKRIYADDVADLYSENVIRHWWQGDGGGTDANNRLIAIIRWVNGEDVFEVEKPKKWIVRSTGLTDDDERYYVSIGKFMGLKRALNTYIISQATRFDTKEEAESWANAHQEVIEVEG